MAFVVEAHSVDERFVFLQPKESGLWIAFLSPGRDRADLYKTESHAGKRLVRLGIFIEASRQSDRMIEYLAPNGLTELRTTSWTIYRANEMTQRGIPLCPLHEPSHLVVHFFRILSKENGGNDPLVQRHGLKIQLNPGAEQKFCPAPRVQ